MTLSSLTPEAFDRRYRDLSAEALIAAALRHYGAGVVATTSFGIHSAVLLHIIVQTAPNLPVIWVDTGYLPPETYRYADRLTRLWNVNVRIYQGAISPAHMEARHGRLWEAEDPAALERYHRIRKVEPLDRALQEHGATAWLSGVRRHQTRHRAALPRAQRHGSLCKIHPLLEWSEDEIDAYRARHNLPPHPLAAQGYRTVGDAHLSRPVTDADHDERSSRFAGRAEECGIHTAGTAGFGLAKDHVKGWSPR